MRYTAAHLDDGHAALGRFQLLHAGMVLRGIATVPAQRLRMKKASVPHNTCASRAARAAKYPFQGNGRVSAALEPTPYILRPQAVLPPHLRGEAQRGLLLDADR